MTEPSGYERRILLAVSGLSPQIVTETLYALCIERVPRFVPTEVHVIATEEGAERVRSTLLAPGTGHFHQFVGEYGLEGRIAFDEGHLHRVTDADGSKLRDIRTAANNASAADLMANLVQQLTSDARAALHVSIAGGRKTMSYYLGYTLSLYARPQDRLSHVLVSEPFESHPEFYFPPREARQLKLRDGRTVSTEEARVELAEIPFVRLRHGIPENLLQGSATFSETVTAVQESVAPAHLAIDLERKTVRCGTKVVKLPPLLFAWVTWLAIRRRDTHDGDGAIRAWKTDPAQFLEIYSGVVGQDAAAIDNARNRLKDGFPDDAISEYNSKLKRALRRILAGAADSYCVARTGPRNDSRFGLSLAPERITITRVQQATDKNGS